MIFSRKSITLFNPLRSLGHGSYRCSAVGEIFRERAAALKSPPEWEGHVETINHKQAIKIKSVFLNSFLIKNKCLINLEHIDSRTQVKSKESNDWHDMEYSMLCVPSQKLWRNTQHRLLDAEIERNPHQVCKGKILKI
jgi:hypothetical protein